MTITPNEAWVEAVARAICNATSGPFEMMSDYGQESCRAESRAAIATLVPLVQHAAMIEGARIALEAAAMEADRRRGMWGCAGGFGGHSAGARIIGDDIRALVPAKLIKDATDEH